MAMLEALADALSRVAAPHWDKVAFLLHAGPEGAMLKAPQLVALAAATRFFHQSGGEVSYYGSKAGKVQTAIVAAP